MREADLTNVARERRRTVALDAWACRADGSRQTVVVTDISRGGCQIRTDTAYEVGEVITLEHEVLGKLPAEVRWSCAGRFGMQFVSPL
jgi:hypothetical protein